MLEPQNTLWADDNCASPSVSTALLLDESTTFAPSNFRSIEVFASDVSGKVGTLKVDAPEYSPTFFVMRTFDTYPLKSKAVVLYSLQTVIGVVVLATFVEIATSPPCCVPSRKSLAVPQELETATWCQALVVTEFAMTRQLPPS